MIDKTVGFTPFRLSASALSKVAFFRFNNTGVALSQSLKTGIAIPLIKALFSHPIAVYAVDYPGELNAHLTTQPGID
jgi:hypothetical protein